MLASSLRICNCPVAGIAARRARNTIRIGCCRTICISAVTRTILRAFVPCDHSVSIEYRCSRAHDVMISGSTIAIAAAADARYALPLAVMLNSLASHARGAAIHAYVLDDGLSVADKDQIGGSLPENVHIEWRRPGPTLTGFPVWGRMSL